MSLIQNSLRSMLCLAALVPCIPLLTASAQSSQADDAGRFKAVDAIVEKAVVEGNIPGAVLLVGHNGQVVHRKAFGSRSLERPAMRVGRSCGSSSRTPHCLTGAGICFPRAGVS